MRKAIVNSVSCNPVWLGCLLLHGTFFLLTSMAMHGHAEDTFRLQLRSIPKVQSGESSYRVEEQHWEARKTAVIICDVWDYHHSINAVRRLEQFAPRMNEFIKEARKRGATIVHAPSDCMPAYVGHAARTRAMETPVAKNSPRDIASWCSKIPAEEQAIYPVDQSDGGEDDDPEEHAAWAKKLSSLGRNPGMPWGAQSSMIEIDSNLDYISDRGDEVWNIITKREIQNVILVGVHTNMCVLGRPFGLRQMARNGIRVVLVRDLTDCMYNPKRWPYVDHFAGNDLVIAHVEQFVSPTITSDQILGGKPFRFQGAKEVLSNGPPTIVAPKPTRQDFERQWSLGSIPNDWKGMTSDAVTEYRGIGWYRCAFRVSKENAKDLRLRVPCPLKSVSAWINGKKLEQAKNEVGETQFVVPPDSVANDEAQLLVIRVDHDQVSTPMQSPTIVGKSSQLDLRGRWQIRLGDDPEWSGIPLPAKFGTPPDIFYELTSK